MSLLGEDDEGLGLPTAGEPFWGVLELFGHRQLAGLISEEERFGEKRARIDIPHVAPTPDRPWFSSQSYGGKAIYGVTRVSEARARELAKRLQPLPMNERQLTARTLDEDEEEHPPESDDDIEGMYDDGRDGP